MPASPEPDSRRGPTVFAAPKGWPYNVVLLFAAGLAFFLHYTRATGAWMTLGAVFIVFAVGESVPAERPVLADLIRGVGLGVVLLVAVLVDRGLIG